ncbi:hypothetical protein [Streptomyces sp. NBC_00102]|uniref:hypothetical protein n=1 Tax=Streptomyces sp. NBC_00102 TaxID=2975652 RepID=UPI00225A969D|nr:hypothetical protein [Streptomyces sp. NBC_00102]MCX5399940.1 hypothetical protein [Streptomyces sp. NBC_00102]
MSVRAGEAFDAGRAVAEVTALAAGPVPLAGPTVGEGDPETGEWRATTGEGFRIVPLWEGDGLTGVYGSDWTDAEGAAQRQLEALVAELDVRWGSHSRVAMHPALFRRQAGRPLPPLHAALLGEDCYGDLSVWGPLPGRDRWIAVSVGHSDGDAPLVMVALVSASPVVEAGEDD